MVMAQLNSKIVSIFTSLSLVLVLAGCATTSGPIMSFGSSNQAGSNTVRTQDVSFSQSDRGAMITTSDSLLFDLNRSDIKAEGASLIKSLVNVAKRTESRLLIEGHTDNIGNEGANRLLSERRAEAVKQALLSGGIASERVTTVGFGSSKPLADNGSEVGRATNRRTEVILLGEKIENINRDDFLANLGNKVTSFIGAVTDRLQYRPTVENFNTNDRIRSVGETTRCGERPGTNYIIIDGSAVEPQTLRKGQQAILTINIQLCIPSGQRRTVDQVINIRRGNTVVLSGGKYSFSNLERTRNNLFSRITIGEAMKPGSYNVETVLTLEGRAYRQTTPIIVQ